MRQASSLNHSDIEIIMDKEDDVKVCDICGDAGEEDLLATCSSCIDGAQHTYCMQTMLDKLPVGDWLCEDCKFKEVNENKKAHNTVAKIQEESCLSKHAQDTGSSMYSEVLLKKDSGVVNLEDMVVCRRRQIPEEVSLLSPEDSFINQGFSTVKPSNPEKSSGSWSLFEGQKTPTSSGSISSAGRDTSKVVSGPLLKPSSFKNTNAKPKIKQLHGAVPLAESASGKYASKDHVSAKHSVDGMSRENTKSNKWKAAIDTIISKQKEYKNTTIKDQSKELPVASFGYCAKVVNNEGDCFKKRYFQEGRTNATRSFVFDKVEPAVHPHKIHHKPGAGRLNLFDNNISKEFEVSSELILPSLEPRLPNISKPSVIPKLEFFWQYVFSLANLILAMTVLSRSKGSAVFLCFYLENVEFLVVILVLSRRGGFEVLRSGRLAEFCHGLQAHFSSYASGMVFEAANEFPADKVQLEEVPCLSSWPHLFHGHHAKEHNIALFFFAKDIESYRSSYCKLLDNMLKYDLALKGKLGNFELLIFPSYKLPENSQRWNRLFFLWGIFK